jgi:hypothetical protein
MPKLPDYVLAQVAAKTTGANVHDVNNVLGAYNAYRITLERVDRESNFREWFVAMAGYRQWSAVLEEFAQSGNIKAAGVHHRYRALDFAAELAEELLAERG